jgi:glycosyltransferase involved in cell wall biosynthesis
MRTRVVDVEYSLPLPSFEPLVDAERLLALVRWHGRPVGMARVMAHHGSVTSDALRTAIEAQVKLLDSTEAPWAKSDARVSVVVCTRDRPHLLRDCLDALCPLAGDGHEVIIVDNAPITDVTATLVSLYPFRYVCEMTPGLNAARNRGVAVARHEIVAFTDDDCIPDSGWLEALAAPYADPNVGAVTGLVMPWELETVAQDQFEAYSANRRIFSQRVYSASHLPPSAAGAAGMGANMSIRRTLAKWLGGFDVRFDGGTPTLSGGDTEMLARVLASGATIVYRPDALVWHRHGRYLPQLRRVIFGYGVGLYAVLTKRLVEDRDWSVLQTAPRWLVGPLVKAAWNRIQGQPATPLDLLWFELWGALHGPGRYRAVRHLARSSIVGEADYSHGYIGA